ncbi:beta strand repeat-containing protein [Cyanobium sp. ATX-6F1]|uniref:beta strand repeat-containing protein n=1 Tax=Cyanobium sp. ATX-6F1 TaxID=3137388 RepID=UPI0039BE2FA2
MTLNDPGTASNLAGNLTVSGTLNIQSPLSASSLALSGGALAGSGSLTVSNAFSRTGGTTGTTLTGVTLNQASGDLSPGAWTVNGPVSFTAAAGNLLVDGPVTATTLLGRGATGLTLQPGVVLNATASTGSALVLDAGTGAFTNLAGAGALAVAPGARWLVYSASPLTDNRGGLSYAFKQYGITYGSASPVLGAGNGFLYSATPTVTASLTGSISKTYDGTVAAPIAAGNYLVSGAIDGDTVQVNNSTLGTYTTAGTGGRGAKDVGSGKDVSVSGVTISGASEGAVAVYGYQLASSTASGTALGTINPLALAGAAIAPSSSIYGAALSPGAVSFSNLFSGDLVGSATSVNTSTLSTGGTPIVGTYTQTASATLSGSDAANYSFSGFTSTPNYTINPLSLSVTGVTPLSKTYDGTTQATLNNTAAAVSGLLGTDGVTLNGLTATGQFADPNAGLAKPVAVSGFVISGPDAANYTLLQPGGLTADITIRPLGTWSASTPGNWSDAANWDVLPSGSNVAVVVIPVGSGALTYDAAAGSTNLQSLIIDQSLSITGGSLAVSGATSVASGASLSLSGGNFSTTSLSNQGLVNGSSPLVVNGSYTESGGSLGSGFSSVAITQASGDLNLSSVGSTGPVSLTSSAGALNLSGAVSSAGGPINLIATGATDLSSTASLISPGALISVSSGGPLSLNGARIDASGASAAGTVQLDGSSITLTNATVNTSGASEGGSIQLGLKSLPSSVTLTNSSLVADPPGLGGSISIDGLAIALVGSTLNVVGLSGGSILLGSANTATLSLDAATSLVGGGDGTFSLFGGSILNNASIIGGRLFLNGVGLGAVSVLPNLPLSAVLSPIVALPSEVAFQLSVDLGQSSPLSSVDYTAPGSLLVAQWEQLGIDPLSITLTESAFLYANFLLNEGLSTSGLWTFDPSVQQLTPSQVEEQFTASEQRAMEATAAKLGLDPTDGLLAPTPAQLQASLQKVIKAVRGRIRGGQP